MNLHIVPLYAAVLALMFVGLSVRTLRLRGWLGIALGDGGHAVLLRAIRVHGNFAEYVPLGLLLLALAEADGAPGWLVHALGLGLVAGRVVHALGVQRIDENPRFRVAGMALTFTTLSVASVYLLGVSAGMPGA